jgi:hypothetical protein
MPHCHHYSRRWLVQKNSALRLNIPDRQRNMMHHAGVVLLSMTPALCDFLPHIGTVALN